MMESAAVSLNEPQQSKSWWRATDAPPPIGIYSGRFSSSVTLLSALFLMVALASVVWLSASATRLDRIESPERALSLMVSRTMDVQEGLKRAPQWEQHLFAWTSGDNETERAQDIEWYQELAEISEDPLVPLQLAILQAEAGHVSQALLSAHEWAGAEAPLPQFGDLLMAAYGEGPLHDADRYVLWQAEVAEVLPAGWFYDRLAERLARRANDAALTARIQDQAAMRADRRFVWSHRLMLVELGAMAVGTLVCVLLWFRRNEPSSFVRLHEPGVPPPWPGGVGAAVLLRGGAIGAMLTALFLIYAPPDNASLRALAIPLTNLPLLLLAYRHLFRPAGMTFDEGFGLEIGWARVGRLMAAVLAVVAAGLWGEWVMDRLSEPFHLTSHWTEWFDADLVWASPSLTAMSLVEYVIFAPVFEELAFRGLLFAILRRKFRFMPAALISASIFAIAHGYGLVGFISVLWSGVLWAWTYEKTGSLLPGILAHAINNLLVCLAVMALLR
ncbi:MAG: CPBP family intramembrane metalloprotease [Nitrospirota bacterium]|nr:CPBP family intramembrane metalloprotease [Nitrospirota bacterium]